MSKKRVLLQLKTLKFPFRKELRFNKSTDNHLFDCMVNWKS